jgi:hypothetical protein
MGTWDELANKPHFYRNWFGTCLMCGQIKGSQPHYEESDIVNLRNTDMTSPPVTISIGAIVHPGDTLVVGYPDKNISQAEADEMQARMEALIPEVRVIIIPASSMAVYRPEFQNPTRTSTVAGEDS